MFDEVLSSIGASERIRSFSYVALVRRSCLAKWGRKISTSLSWRLSRFRRGSVLLRNVGADAKGLRHKILNSVFQTLIALNGVVFEVFPRQRVAPELE